MQGCTTTGRPQHIRLDTQTPSACFHAAVLEGLTALRRLGLHHYRQMDLLGLPPGVAASLHSLEVSQAGGWGWAAARRRGAAGCHRWRALGWGVGTSASLGALLWGPSWFI